MVSNGLVPFINGGQPKCCRKVNTQLPFVGVMAAMAAEVGDVAHDRLPLLYMGRESS